MPHPASSPRAPFDVTPEGVEAVDHAITSRRSMRRFLPTPVERATIEDILQVAARAPSGTNTQPWQVHVLTGASQQALVSKVLSAAAQSDASARYTEQYDYYPAEWVSPYIDRRRKVGMQLYGLLGIQKGDAKRMHEQFARNYKFFDAPVGLMFTIDPIMGRGSLFDYGMFVQNIMLAARARGLHTCPQAAWNGFHSIILPHIGAGEGEMMVCGMSLGYADESAVVNTFKTTRVDARDFTHWVE